MVQRVLSIPADLTWEELVRFLSFYGFSEMNTGKTGGSRRKFIDSNSVVISLHKPHPGNIVKEYAIKDAIGVIKEKGKIKDE